MSKNINQKITKLTKINKINNNYIAKKEIL